MRGGEQAALVREARRDREAGQVEAAGVRPRQVDVAVAQFAVDRAAEEQRPHQQVDDRDRHVEGRHLGPHRGSGRPTVRLRARSASRSITVGQGSGSTAVGPARGAAAVTAGGPFEMARRLDHATVDGDEVGLEQRPVVGRGDPEQDLALPLAVDDGLARLQLGLAHGHPEAGALVQQLHDAPVQRIDAAPQTAHLDRLARSHPWHVRLPARRAGPAPPGTRAARGRRSRRRRCRAGS